MFLPDQQTHLRIGSILPFIELMKPRISALVLITSYLGFYLGLRSQGQLMLDAASWIRLAHLLLGSFLAASGAAVLNQYIERVPDGKMKRTQNRPLPAGRIRPGDALVFGIFLSTAGILYLVFSINLITGFLSFLTVALYLFLYTPMKRITTWNTIIGSIPGALPPLGGWTAATGSLDAPAWIGFGILFCWQIPHFLAIAIIYSKDYPRGGFKMLPSEYPTSNQTIYHILFFIIALIGTSIGLFILKLGGIIYAVGAGLAGLIFLIYGLNLVGDQTNRNARYLLLASIVYLPVLLILILIS